MNKRDAVSMSFKLIGVICFVLALKEIPLMGFFMVKFGRELIQGYTLILRYLYIFISPIILLLIAYILMKYSDKIASNLIPIDSPLFALAPNYEPKQVFMVALKVVGLVFLIKGIQDTISAILSWIAVGRGLGIVDPFPWNTLSGVITMLFAHYLITGGDWFVKRAFEERKEG